MRVGTRVLERRTEAIVNHPRAEAGAVTEIVRNHFDPRGKKNRQRVNDSQGLGIKTT